MKTLILALPLLVVPIVAHAQMPAAVSDKNIRECVKRSPKTPTSFDRCVAEEFQRVREDKAYREARIRVGKDPYGGCGKPSAYKDCFQELMSDLRATNDRLYDGSGYSYSEYVPIYRYRPRYHYRYRPYYPIYPRFYLPRTWRRY